MFQETDYYSMKKALLIILTTVLSTHCFSQISFEKGYYIDNDEQKIECLIKNSDWRSNPTEFEYKLSENSEQKKATIELVKEFGIYNYSKFLRTNVNIDRSSKNFDDLSILRNPVFKEETLFLKILIDGKASLYQYIDGNLIRFFFSNDYSNNIEQLVFKNYKVSSDLIGENNMFRQQLLNDLKCQNIKDKDIKKAKYDKDDLSKFFTQYNECDNSESTNFVEKQKRDLFNLSLRLGVNSSSLSIVNGLYSDRSVDFENKLVLRFGIEAEFILPFYKNKWALIIEPTYQSYKSEKELTTSNAKVEYSSIQLPLGLRHYFFLNNNSKIFINASYIRDFPNNSSVSYNTGSEWEITKTDASFGFGIGYKKDDKYSLEFRYHTARAIVNSDFIGSDYNTSSIIFGYSIF